MNSVKLHELQTVIRELITVSSHYNWQLQGMGMFRLYMGNARLHVWDQTYKAPGVSMIHDHLQWGLESVIVAGELINQRYIQHSYDDCGGEEYNCVTLKAGIGTKFVDEPHSTWLTRCMLERYRAGSRYKQRPEEIHETIVPHLAITLMTKTPTGSDLARVFWPKGEVWGTAEPRLVTPDEFLAMRAKALRLLDDELRGNS